MNQLVTREMLEEIMLSFTIDVYSEEDIEFINQVYSDYMNKKYIFQLSKTEQYFKQFVITYCRVNYQTIVDKINFTNQQNKDDFIRNFGEKPKTHNKNVVLEIPGNENEPLLANNEHQNKDDFIRNFGEEPKTHNKNVVLEIPGNEDEPLLANNEHQNIQMEENSNKNMIYYIIGGVVMASVIGFGIYLYKKYYS